MRMTEHAVVIAGGGPTGLMLAGELALAGVDIVIVERSANKDVHGARARGPYLPTRGWLDRRGGAKRFLRPGKVHPAWAFPGPFLATSAFPPRHNYLLALW